MTRQRQTTRRKRKSDRSFVFELPMTAYWVAGVILILMIISGVWLKNHYQATPDLEETTQQSSHIKPTFDFYQLLPKIEVPGPNTAPATTRPITEPTPPATKPLQTPSTTRYVLQVASFKSFTDADALKAKLSLLGLQVNVRHYEANDHQDWYRVWIGPYASQDDAHEAQQRLHREHINSLLRTITVG